MKKLIIPLFFCQLLFLNISFAQPGIVAPLNNYQLLSLARMLPNEGKLRQSADGYVYLKIPSSYYIHLLPFLKVDAPIIDRPKIGAHITVFTAEEAKEHLIFNIPELNQAYKFTVSSVNKVYTKDVIEGTKIWYVLIVDAPELKKLREKYKSLGEFNFHITLASQKV